MSGNYKKNSLGRSLIKSKFGKVKIEGEKEFVFLDNFYKYSYYIQINNIEIKNKEKIEKKKKLQSLTQQSDFEEFFYNAGNNFLTKNYLFLLNIKKK